MKFGWVFHENVWRESKFITIVKKNGLLHKVLVNNQTDAPFSIYSFVSLLYMLRVTPCSSSGESNCINTSSGIYQYV